MSRTAAGYIFKCKNCGEDHLCKSVNIVKEKLESEGKVTIKCKHNSNKKEEYSKDELEWWYGSYWGVFNIMVEAE